MRQNSFEGESGRKDVSSRRNENRRFQVDDSVVRAAKGQGDSERGEQWSSGVDGTIDRFTVGNRGLIIIISTNDVYLKNPI